MAHTDRDTTVVHTQSGSGAGWFVAGLLIAVVAFGLYAFSTGMFIGGETNTLDVELTLPATE